MDDLIPSLLTPPIDPTPGPSPKRGGECRESLKWAVELSREYMKFYVGGCQGDRRSINTGGAPFFEDDKGEGG